NGDSKDTHGGGEGLGARVPQPYRDGLPPPQRHLARSAASAPAPPSSAHWRIGPYSGPAGGRPAKAQRPLADAPLAEVTAGQVRGGIAFREPVPQPLQPHLHRSAPRPPAESPPPLNPPAL